MAFDKISALVSAQPNLNTVLNVSHLSFEKYLSFDRFKVERKKYLFKRPPRTRQVIPFESLKRSHQRGHKRSCPLFQETPPLITENPPEGFPTYFKPNGHNLSRTRNPEFIISLRDANWDEGVSA